MYQCIFLNAPSLSLPKCRECHSLSTEVKLQHCGPIKKGQTNAWDSPLQTRGHAQTPGSARRRCCVFGTSFSSLQCVSVRVSVCACVYTCSCIGGAQIFRNNSSKLFRVKNVPHIFFWTPLFREIVSNTGIPMKKAAWI